MRIDAIVYKSSTGHTKKYAELLSDILSIPIMTTRNAFIKLPRESNILFMGWIRGKDYMGYNLFLKKHRIKAACIVGAVETAGELIGRVRKNSKISSEIPIFYLRGGYDREKTKGADRQMSEAIIKQLAKKRKTIKNISDYENELLETMVYGRNFVEEGRLQEIISWYNSCQVN